MKLLRDDMGKAVLVRYDDVGRIEGVLVDIVDHEPTGREAKVFFLNDKTIDNVELSQIVEVGKRIKIPY